jgi:hypothetical protein
MSRSIDIVFKAVAVAVFAFCVERRRRRGTRIERPAVSSRARLRVRHEVPARRVTFAVEGRLDPFTARMLVHSVAQVSLPLTAIIDLSAAAPIRGEALPIFARVFAAGRRVRLRGAGECHPGLLALDPAFRQAPAGMSAPEAAVAA